MPTGKKKSSAARPSSAQAAPDPVLSTICGLLEDYSEAVVILDVSTLRILWANPKAAGLWAWPREQFAGMHVRELYPPENRIYKDEEVKRINLAGGLVDMFAPIQRTDGTSVESLMTALTVFIEGRPFSIGFFRQDSVNQLHSALRQAQGTMHLTEQTYKQLLEAMSEGLVMADAHCRISFVNDQLCRMFGFKPEELIGRQPREFMSPGDSAAIQEQFSRNAQGQARSFERTWKTPDGRDVHTLTSTRPLYNECGQYKGAVWVITDLTENHRLQQQFIQAQRMESIGRLAGGVAHDIRNQLTVIKGYADLLAAERSPKAVDEYLRQIAAATARAEKTTSQLLAYSRQQLLSPQRLDLATVLEELRKPLAHLLGENIRLDLDVDKPVSRALVDRALLEQAVINLAINARDAMGKSGKVRVSLHDALIDQEFAWPVLDEIAPGRYVAIEFADTGCGMDKTTLKRIFDPFFTTKEIGKGTGLGLAMVYGFLRQSGGAVGVHSEPGAGTTFWLYLPPADRPA